MQAVNRKFLKRALLCVGGLAAMSSALTVHAQSAPQGEISIPDDVKIFGNDNPNMRRATAVVNGDVITGTDVDQRLALIVAANQGKIDEEELKRLRLQVLRNLIDETLQIQEAKAADVSVDEAEINQSYARVAQQNFGQNTSAMDAYLKRVGSSADSLKRQIRGELSWQRLLQRNVQPFINVSDDEVNDVLARLKAAKGTDEYRLGEIYLAASPEARDQVYQNATQIVQQLKGGGSFVAYARQYSQASTASVGGDLGWVRLAQLPTELQAVARDMESGQLVGPIEVPGGFDILYLIDKRQVLTADPRDAVLALKQISLPFPKGVSEAEAGKRAEAFQTAMKAAKGCGDVDGVAKGLGAQVVTNDQVKARDLPAQIQNSILQLSPGETLPPFGSLEDGVRILMLCGRDDPQTESGPSFEQLQAQLEDDRVNKRAQTYLRDLRRDAVIEYN
ncbi:peptidylprolyl isomerase [Novosphingobium resinovorum]|uniref:Parvulin-like PPIase n=1 Tax=Novosphingobium resinovorum TaxID=158500 RepID=A0A1D8A8U5_9SPHN|nr:MULTISPECIES: peptidylprolyl isomerase [Sphingomonadaceae]AOR78506.1 peptidylprolyl isomerase [Novosphingobium resinovorum]EJU14269.1 PpiC-type peptidyl-prolyl cis-trans isomerase [Sphingomonas sp. LH128]WJM26449.1 peptidylprolyl isomerase [Novosphingobium resinovorum]